MKEVQTKSLVSLFQESWFGMKDHTYGIGKYTTSFVESMIERCSYF